MQPKKQKQNQQQPLGEKYQKEKAKDISKEFYT